MSLLKTLFTPFASQPKPFTTSSATQFVLSAIVAPLSSSPPTSTSSLSPNFDFSIPIVYATVAEDAANHLQDSVTNMDLLLHCKPKNYLPLVRIVDDLIKVKQDCTPQRIPTPQVYSQALIYEDEESETDETESLGDLLELFPMPPSAPQNQSDDQVYANESKIDKPKVNLDDLLRLFSTPLPETEDPQLEQEQEQETDSLLDIIAQFPKPPTHTFTPPVAMPGPKLSRANLLYDISVVYLPFRRRTIAYRSKLDENGALISKPRRQTRRRALAPLN